MILLWGVPGDAPLDSVAATLGQLGADVHLLDQRRAASMQVELGIGRDGELSGFIEDAGQRIDLAAVRAAYIRPNETGRACGSDTPADSTFHRASIVDSRLIAWADLSHAAMVNRPLAMAANNSKPYQLALIAESGFAVPDTLVTTDAGALRQFIAHHGEIIYKSVSGIRSIVSRLHCADREALRDIANCPTQFQQYIPGKDIRVHVAGEQLLAIEIESEADDYRYAYRVNRQVAMNVIDLPDEIARKCSTMARRMDLQLAGIDFRLTPEGTWYCLEVNPSPGFTYFEAATGQPIARAVASLLLRLDQSGA
jgi:glutathione synthase/RimK-type ligase-like ATP-grasp enzyme